MTRYKFSRPLDYLIAVAILACAAVSLKGFSTRPGTRAEVYIGSRKAAAFDISGKVEEKEIPSPAGAITVRFGNGGIRVVGSPCPQKICIRQGEIRHAHQQIICMPARILITLSGAAPDSSGEVDAITR